MRILVLLSLTGCIAGSQHVEEGDRLVATLGDVVKGLATKLAESDAKYIPEAIRADIVATEIKQHAEESATPAALSAAASTIGAGLELWVGGGLSLTALLGLGARKGLKAYSDLKTTAVEAAHQNPDQAIETLKKKGYHA